MDRVFSTRLDDDVILEMDRITHRLRMTKKRFLEEAIRLHSRQLDARERTDVWAETAGAWKRRETPRRTVERARSAFRKSFDRHHR